MGDRDRAITARSAVTATRGRVGDEDGPVMEAGQGDRRTREKKKAAIAATNVFSEL